MIHTVLIWMIISLLLCTLEQQQMLFLNFNKVAVFNFLSFSAIHFLTVLIITAGFLEGRSSDCFIKLCWLRGHSPSRREEALLQLYMGCCLLEEHFYGYSPYWEEETVVTATSRQALCLFLWRIHVLTRDMWQYWHHKPLVSTMYGVPVLSTIIIWHTIMSL